MTNFILDVAKTRSVRVESNLLKENNVAIRYMEIPLCYVKCAMLCHVVLRCAMLC